MGLFNRIFNSAKSAETSGNATGDNLHSESVALDIPAISIHPDICELIWIADGPYKNVTKEMTEKDDCYTLFEADGVVFRISVRGMHNAEPSMIYTSLPFTPYQTESTISKPPYYPCYKNLSAEQKGAYLSFLRNPYDSSYDVGYAFLLYYGLERHLMQGNREKAFWVILKMRDAFSNKSFQSYTANALILTCLAARRYDLLEEFLNSLDNLYEYEFSRNLLLACSIGLNHSLTPREIMVIAKNLPKANMHYIKDYPEVYERCLDEIISGSLKLRLSGNTVIPSEPVTVFANPSISEAVVEVPNLFCDPGVFASLSEATSAAHEATKEQLAMLRKDRRAPEKQKRAEKKEVVFDSKIEDELVSAYESAESNSFDKHFAAIGLAAHYYKYRDTIPGHLEKCLIICRNDISMLPYLQDMNQRETGQWFRGVIPAFERLAIVFEKQKNYEKAISICCEAIEYYSKYEMPENAQDFIDRTAKINKKAAKASSIR